MGDIQPRISIFEVEYGHYKVVLPVDEESLSALQGGVAGGRESLRAQQGGGAGGREGLRAQQGGGAGGREGMPDTAGLFSRRAVISFLSFSLMVQGVPVPKPKPGRKKCSLGPLRPFRPPRRRFAI